MTPAQSIRVLGENVTRQPGPMEIEQAVEKAFAAQVARTTPRPCKHSYKPDRLTQIARRMDGFGPAELAARSPIRPDTRTPASFLHSLYKPGEQILLFTRFRSQGQAVATRPPDGEPYDARALEEFTKPPEGMGAWFLCNPVSGDWITLERLKSPSNPKGLTCRARENITSFRYLVMESDIAPPALWLAALVQIPLPIVAIYSSGGKSIHSLVRMDAQSSEHWHELKGKLAPALLTLGADDAAMSDVRLSRLPGCFRAEKGRWQELLYLNPQADETPICELPVQETPEQAAARFADIRPAFDCETFEHESF